MNLTDYDIATGHFRTPEAQRAAQPNVAAAMSVKEALPDATEADLAAIDNLFPYGEPPFNPYGPLVLVQDRGKRTKIGSIHLTHLTQEKDAWIEFIGRVVLLGPLAFWDELGGNDLPEAPWFRPGEFVVLPKFSQDRYKDVGENQPCFRLVHFKDIRAKVLTVRKVVLP
jgi:hypothetical protein